MPSDPLVRLLTDRLLAAQDVLSRRSGWTRGLLAPRIPPDTVREVSAALVPVIRQAAQEAMEDAVRSVIDSSSEPDPAGVCGCGSLRPDDLSHVSGCPLLAEAGDRRG